MTTVFDGSTQRDEYEHSDAPAVAAPEPELVVDSLSLLRGALAEHQAEAPPPPVVIDVPGGRFRLHCTTEITSAEVTQWQRKSLPPKLRNSPKISPLHVNQRILNATILAETTVYMEVRRSSDGSWHTVEDARGQALTFSDGLPQALGTLDAESALKMLFRRDADLLAAGQQVLDAAGFGDRIGGGEEDPTM